MTSYLTKAIQGRVYLRMAAKHGGRSVRWLVILHLVRKMGRWKEGEREEGEGGREGGRQERDRQAGLIHFTFHSPGDPSP